MQVGLPRFGGEFLVNRVQKDHAQAALHPYDLSHFSASMPQGLTLAESGRSRPNGPMKHQEGILNPGIAYGGKNDVFSMRINVSIPKDATDSEKALLLSQQQQFEDALAAYLKENKVAFDFRSDYKHSASPQGIHPPVITKTQDQDGNFHWVIKFPGAKKATPDFSQADSPVQREKKADRS